jgi:DNA-cytosine methyltransferase
MSLGFEQAGFEIVGAFDIWEDALRVYRKNLGHPTFCVDLKNVLPAAQLVRSLRPKIIIGGPPCQDFSSAGSRTEGENAEMTAAFAMIAVIARPTWIVIENVPQMLKSKAWEQARQILTEGGYGISVSAVNAAFYGVPQHRKRVVVVCRRGEADGFMQTAIEQAAAEKPMALCELFQEETPDFVYSHPRFKGKRCTFGAGEPLPTVRSTSRRPVPKRYREEDAALLGARHFFVRPFHTGRGVRTVDEPCPAIIRTSREKPRPAYLTAPHPSDPVHPSQAKTLTQAQTSRVQGFPAWWDWSDARTVRDVDQMIANAVPAPLARAIATLILQRENGCMPPISAGFLAWLENVMGLAKKAVQNIKDNLSHALQYLGGRVLADQRLELHKLETTVEFAAMSVLHRSAVRKALKLYQQWRSSSGKAGLQEHQMPDRGGLRQFFKDVGKRILASLRLTKDRAKPQKTRRNLRIHTPVAVSLIAPTPLSESREVAGVETEFALNGSKQPRAIMAHLDRAPTAPQHPHGFWDQQSEAHPPAEGGREFYRHPLKSGYGEELVAAVAEGDGTSTGLKFEIKRE